MEVFLFQEEGQKFSINTLGQRVGGLRDLRLSNTHLETICQEGVRLEKSAEWKKPKCKCNVVNKDCRSRKYEVIYDTPRMMRKNLFIMNNCMHNEYVGLHNRYLKETNNTCTYNRAVVDNILDELVMELKPHWDGILTLEEFMDTKKGKLYTRYSDAVRKINKNGYNVNKHNTTSAFVKNELYDEVKPPRMIINRDTRFNLDYGRYTRALEHCMMKVPQFSKGKDFHQRGEQFGELVFNENCWILEGDASKFEGTQRPELLEHIELGIWKRILNSKDYAHIFKVFMAKMKKYGQTENGVKFSFYGCRGSGDMDTGLFNSILMYVACRYFELVNNFGWKGKFMVDGDDNVIRMPKIETYINTFAHFGFDAKLIVRKDYHDVDYCSGKFIKVNNNKFMYVQNIIKIINNMSIFRKIKYNHCKAQYYHSLGYMYKVIYGELPMFKEFSDFLLRSTTGQYVSTEILRELNPVYEEVFKLHENVKPIECSNDIEIELAMSFDLSPGYIHNFRQHFENAFISFRVEECRRNRMEMTTRNVLEQVEIMKCETLLDG